ncbi:MAG: AAA family ATPase [Pseudomonadota bacterium]
MYLLKIRLENAGPIDLLEKELPVQGNRAPKPLVLVGPNGSGKSIFLSHVVSAMMNAHGAIFEDGDMKKGKVYKLRSPSYIRRGETYSLSCLEFTGGLYEDEVTLVRTKADFEEHFQYTPIFKRWNDFKPDLNSTVLSNFHSQLPTVREALIGPHLYFPPNRFEDPAWLNEVSLKNVVEYFDAKRFAEISERPIVQYAPMRENQKWLLDLIYDSFAVERRYTHVPILGVQHPLYALDRDGAATKILNKIEDFVRLLLGGEGDLGWGVGGRSRRTISVSASGQELTSNLFALSTGQAVLFDLFLTILRHADFSGQIINQLSDVKGLVVVDEVDLHLHTSLQFEMLPKLLHMFPGVQFILSSHSPLFLLGMEKSFGETGMIILDMPTGEEISAERFCEFEEAYRYLADTRKFETEINSRLSETTQPLLIVEGTTDIDYIRKAAEHLGKTGVLDPIEFVDGDGFKGLDKIWKNLSTERWSNVT